MTYVIASTTGRTACASDHATAHDIAERLSTTGMADWFHEVDGKPCTQHVCNQCQGTDPDNCPNHTGQLESHIVDYDASTLDVPVCVDDCPGPHTDEWTLPSSVSAAYRDFANRLNALWEHHRRIPEDRKYALGINTAFNIADAYAREARDAEQDRMQRGWDEQRKTMRAELRAWLLEDSATGVLDAAEETHLDTLTDRALRVSLSEQKDLRYLRNAAADRADQLQRDYAELQAAFAGQHLVPRTEEEERAPWVKLLEDYSTQYGGGLMLDLDKVTDGTDRDEGDGRDFVSLLIEQSQADRVDFTLKASEAIGAVQADALFANREKEDLYRQRAQILALLTKSIPAVLTDHTPDEFEGEEGWQALYAYLGDEDANDTQVSWHIAPQDAPLFAHVEQVPADDPRARFDGHTTPEKGRRIRRFLGAPETALTALLTGVQAADEAFTKGIHNGIAVATIEDGGCFIALGHHDKDKALEAFNAYATQMHGRPVNYMMTTPSGDLTEEEIGRALLDRIEHTHGHFFSLPDGWDVNFDDDAAPAGLVPLTVAEVY